MNFCPNKPLTVKKRIAKVVPNGTAGALSFITDGVFVNIPSPRVQCQVSFNALPYDRNQFAQFFAFNYGDGSSFWNVCPILDAAERDDDLRNYTPTPGTFPAIMTGIAGLGIPGLDLAAAGLQNWGVSYLIRGETNRLWLVQLGSGLPLKQGASPSGLLMFYATFEPMPEANMSPAEWAYWRARCDVKQMIGNDNNPPILQASP